MQKKKRDYHAKLVIHDLPTMSGKEVKRLRKWLYGVWESLEEGDEKEFAKVYTARLMK